MLLKKDYKSLFKICFSCKSPDHLFEDCPFLHYIPNKDLIIQKHLYGQPNHRNAKFKRKNHLKCQFNALKNYSLLQSAFHDKQNTNKSNDFNSIQENKKSYLSSSLVEEEENLSFSDLEDNEKESNQFIDTININEMRKEEEKEYEERNTLKENDKILYQKEKTNSHKKEEFEKSFIKQFELKKKILLNQKNREKNGPNLFDFSFEKAKNFKFYYNNENFDKNLRKYKKSIKGRRKKNLKE